MATKQRSRASSADGVVDPAARDKYLLQVTAGPGYDTSTHAVVDVNGDDAHYIENDIVKCWLKVRIRDYHGLPKGSPSTNSYFQHPLHLSDRYSIGFSFVPKKSIPGQDLVTGFDFDHSIRDRLPPGFKYAMKIVTTILDPGIYSDPYSNKPYLYGPALSSFFSFRIGEHVTNVDAETQLAGQLAKDEAGVIEEGADGSGQEIRENLNIPSKTNKRRKNFLTQQNLENFTFEEGRLYQADFFNPYLDFANFALRIPGFSISVVKYIDNKTHQLRFVLRNRSTNEVLFVVTFTLLFGESLKEALQGQDATDSEDVPQTLPRKPSQSSTPVTPPDSEFEEGQEEVQESPGAASTLASTITSSFAYLGFGRRVSSSESSTNSSSRAASPEKQRKKLDRSVEEMDPGVIEDFLRQKQTAT